MKELEPNTKELPADILFSNLLPRLPTKSQSRFRCVSKQWHSFLTTPEFLKMHRQHVIDNHHQINQKLLLLPNNRPWEFHTIDCETPEDGLTAIRPLPFKVGPRQKMSIVSSLHGMVCVGLVKPRPFSYEYSDLILWNPVTGDYKKLSKARLSYEECYQKYRVQFGLYYSSSKDDYQLVCLTYHPNVYIYSLKSDSWRKVESTGSSSSRVTYYSVESVVFNEKFYFLYFDPVPKLYSLVAFDTQTEKLRDITTPHFVFQGARYMGFMVGRDCIHLYVAKRNSIGPHYTIEEWRTDGDGDWTMAESSSWKERLSHIKHFMRNGNWFMCPGLEESLYVVDTKKQTKKYMSSISIAFHPDGKYIETFVSPNQYMNFTEDQDQQNDVEDDLKHKEGTKSRWGLDVPGIIQFVGVFMFLYFHISNWNRRQIISVFM